MLHRCKNGTDVGEIIHLYNPRRGTTTYFYCGNTYRLLSNAMQDRFDRESHRWDTAYILRELTTIHHIRNEDSKNLSMWNKFLMFILRRK